MKLFGRSRRLWLCLTVFFAFSPSLAESWALRTVQPGDSLSAIADMYSVSVDELLEANSLDSTTIRPGQTLKVPFTHAVGGLREPAPTPPPGFRLHTISAGETLSALVESYGITVEALVGANPDLSSLDRLPVGLELLIPPGEGLVVTLESGQSVLDVMSRYGIGAAELADANQIRTPQDLLAREMLFLPGVKPVEALERLARVREAERVFRWPLQGRLTSYFGRRNLGMGTSSFHSAIDVAAPLGTPLLASRSGVVTFSGWSGSYGRLVKIRHANGFETWYAHNSRNLVSVGQRVQQGEVVALVGSTGLSTGPHVHFEIRERGRPLDPLGFLP